MTSATARQSSASRVGAAVLIGAALLLATTTSATADCTIIGQTVFGEHCANTIHADPFETEGFFSVIQDTGVVGPGIEIVLVDPHLTADFWHTEDKLEVYVNGSFADFPFNGLMFELTDEAAPPIVTVEIASSTFPGFDASRLFHDERRIALHYGGLANVGTVVIEIAYAGSACPADLDGSGAVDFGDILIILGAWGNVGGSEDLDESGIVDFGDLLIVLSAWGACA